MSREVAHEEALEADQVWKNNRRAVTLKIM